MKTVLVLLAIIFLAGCATAGYQGMSAEQITALSKMKDANVNCVKGNTVWTGPFISVFLNYDKGVIPEGGISVDGDCKVTLTNTKVTTTVTTVTTPIAPPK